ncbi:MAG TPA: hypothetical protein VGI69_00885 [Gaiellaceae bacterium]
MAEKDSSPEEKAMDSIATPLAVHDWRTEQLRRLGLPWILAEGFADLVDWHAVEDLVARGCTLSLALDIVR